MKGFAPRLMHPLLQILLALGLAIGGLCLATVLALLLASQLYGLSLAAVLQLSAQPGAQPHTWGALMLLQGASLLGAGAGVALMPAIVGLPWRAYFAPRRLGSAGWLLGAAALVIVILPFMSMLIAWNAQAHFPAFVHDFELWAKDKEDQAAVLTKFLTQLNSTGRLLVGLVVIAVVPAVAEELVFRGVIQQNLVRWFNSRHLGVWLAAALFSAIHMQFFGFVPRFVLGLVLGYLYEWSGNLLVPIAAHFTQNALQLLLLFLAQRGYFGAAFDPDANEALPWPVVLLSALLTAGLLYFLRQRMAAPTSVTLSHDGVSTAAANEV
ncbi:type II CAAX endopeptidase family protein [Hymenobacter sp. ASUV-10]|uniref:Type II CAAX endopeptidase family protein n=1 Tax=Hymenobacter aranciens TaxID=3063996 RepID=A0ABT9B9A0_9BACT|nr:type II CAAX endopeptidase family protein [Hymenobacter sp. ASUV-10]MDO7874852.1 type II CAAX endopeptidase family protein [Hymenobacter sp. ASUV-10]